MITSVAELRRAFLDYFVSKGHTEVVSSPLVPANDPTLLFTNAGMVQFKETFLGTEPRSYTRATTCQRCVRAGGKHNDLENVGYTARHHTFFEMLGNFSFGDYFKREAIEFAWEFLTKELKLPPEKLWITVYEKDDEAADIWLKELKVDPTRFSRCGEKDNFWSMGDTGPCGPCTEIFYDHGNTVAGGPPGSPDEDGDRYIEIWNLVFMQYDRDAAGNLTPLPKPSVDTGMGLERLAAVMQHVHSNYEIDLFQYLIKAIAELADCKDFANNSLKVIADHIRACSFLVVDGVVPSNEGRGYVLRRIIRRAIRHGHKLGLRDAFFHQLVQFLADKMGQAYPELAKNQAMIVRVLKQEEARFAETLDQGMKVLEGCIADLSDKTIPGEVVFKLYDTYGFPVDLTADIARERLLTVDHAGFEAHMTAQRQRARASSQFDAQWDEKDLQLDVETVFSGYDKVEDEGTITALIVEGKMVTQLNAGQEGQVVLNRTPFYAESGGQVGDKGVLNIGKNTFEVTDTQKIGKAFVHLGVLHHGEIKMGDTLVAKIQNEERESIARNHSATHLMHAALRKVLGEHVKQKGSLVNSFNLRFDFSHFEPVTPAQLAEVEDKVNQQILQNTLVNTQLMDLDEAIQSGAMALFGEKYDEKVRVLTMGSGFSVELCGGTHVNRLGDIGLFKIIAETGTAAGVRRIEAITGNRALAWLTNADSTLNRFANLLKSNREDLEDRILQLIEQTKQNDKEIAQLKAKLASSQGDELTSQAVDVQGIKVLAAKLDNVEVKQLRDTLDQLKNKLGTAAIVLAVVKGDKISLVAGVTKDATNKIKAGELVNHVAQQVGGKGGGRPDMAQAGGKDVDKLPEALTSVVGWVKGKIS